MEYSLSCYESVWDSKMFNFDLIFVEKSWIKRGTFWDFPHLLDFPHFKGISHLCFRWNTPLICWCVDWKFGACSWRDNIIVWNHSYYNGIRGKPTIPTLDQTDLSTSRWMWLYAMEIYRGFMKCYVEYRRNTKELHITRRKSTDADLVQTDLAVAMTRFINQLGSYRVPAGSRWFSLSSFPYIIKGVKWNTWE